MLGKWRYFQTNTQFSPISDHPHNPYSSNVASWGLSEQACSLSKTNNNRAVVIFVKPWARKSAWVSGLGWLGLAQLASLLCVNLAKSLNISKTYLPCMQKEDAKSCLTVLL